MAIQFFESVMGHRFYEATVPRAVKALERLATALEAVARSTTFYVALYTHDGVVDVGIYQNKEEAYRDMTNQLSAGLRLVRSDSVKKQLSDAILNKDYRKFVELWNISELGSRVDIQEKAMTNVALPVPGTTYETT